MSENALVIVFPALFSKNKVDLLLRNIKKILQIKNLQIQTITRDDSVIIVEANDPVFTSSAINLLFGIDKIAIAKQVSNKFDVLVSAITKIGANLLLKNETFYVKVEGRALGYLPKDVEISATSSLIEKASKLDAKPGTETSYNKLLYTYLTKSHGYVCIFMDKGSGGLPNNSQNEKIICCVYDELSAISCLQTISEGFDVKIIVCYYKESDLLSLVKILNRIIPRTLREKIDLEFFQLPFNLNGKILFAIEVITEILITIANVNRIHKIAIATPYVIFPSEFIDKILLRIYRQNLIPHIPITTLDNDIFENVKKIGLSKDLPKIEKFGLIKFRKTQDKQKEIMKIARGSIKTKKIVTVMVGPNNIHDILDSLKNNH
jgi:hypothetical protein